MKKVLVTGAGGYIGRHVAAALSDLGYAVTAVDARPFEADSRVKTYVCNIFSDASELYEKFGKPDILVHMAWRDGFVHQSPAHLEDLPAHYRFLKSMVEAGCRKVGVMGSMHEIGYYEGAIDENTPTNPSSLYGVSKNALRQLMEALQRTTPFTLFWLRGFYICGDDTNNCSIFSKLLQKAELGEEQFPFTTGTSQYDFIEIGDLALQIALVVTQDRVTGTINCCTGKPVALKDKVEAFIRERGLSIRLAYGVFPERPYDSKIIYGDNRKMKEILSAATNEYSSDITNQIQDLLSAMA